MPGINSPLFLRADILAHYAGLRLKPQNWLSRVAQPIRNCFSSRLKLFFTLVSRLRSYQTEVGVRARIRKAQKKIRKERITKKKKNCQTTKKARVYSTFCKFCTC